MPAQRRLQARTVAKAGIESYYNSVRVHSSLGNEPIGLCGPPPDAVLEEKDGIICEAWLGGLLRHYRRAAA